MEEKEIRILKEALTLLFYYDQVPSFREDFNKKMSSGGVYLGRPVFFYVQILVMYSPLYRRYYRKFTRTTSTASRIKFFVKRQPNMIENFLRACYHNGRTEYWKLWNTVSPPGLFSASELETINRMEKEQDTPNKNLLFTQFMSRINAMGRSTGATPQFTQAQTLAYSLQAKILKYGKYMQTAEGREQLINNPQNVLDAEDLKNKVTLTREDLDFALKAGLIAGADVSSKEDPKRFLKPDGVIDQDKHFEAIFEAYYAESVNEPFKNSLPPDIQHDLARYDLPTRELILQGLKTGKKGEKWFKVKKVGGKIQYLEVDPKTKDEFVIIPEEISTKKEVTIEITTELPIAEPKSETSEPTEVVMVQPQELTLPQTLVPPVSTPLSSVTTQEPETTEVLQTKKVTAQEPQKEINIPDIPSPKTLSRVKTQVNLAVKQIFNRTKAVVFQTRALTNFISNAPAVKNGAYAVLVGVRGGLGAVSKGLLGVGVKGVAKTGLSLAAKTGAKIVVGALIPGPGWVGAAIAAAPVILGSLKKVVLFAVLLTLFLMFGLSFLINSIFKGGAALNPISQAESAILPTGPGAGPTITPGGPTLTPFPTLPPGQYCAGRTTPPPPGTSTPVFKDLGVIGRSAKGDPIKAYSLGNGANHVAIVGGMNGQQERSGIHMVEAIRDVFKLGGNYNIPNNLTIYLIPEITPGTYDGFNSEGQDVNRNFTSSVPGGQWSAIACSRGRYVGKPGSYLTSCQDDNTKELFSEYCNRIAPGAPNSTNQFTCAPNKTGSGPFSESETIAVRNFIQGNSIKAVISYRAPINNVSSSNVPYGQKLPGVKDLGDIFARELGIQQEEYFVYYPVNGQFMDWLHSSGIIGTEIELPDANTLGENIKTKNLRAAQEGLNFLSRFYGGNPSQPPQYANLREAIKNKFGINMVGNFTDDQLKWTWEKFWDISSTNFIDQLKNSYCKGATVQAVSSGSSQNGCTVYVGNTFGETLFKVVLLHELGHVVYWTSNTSYSGEHNNLYNTLKYGVTSYGNGNPFSVSCLTDDNGNHYNAVTENYPEMLTYYLMPGVVEQTAAACSWGKIPYGDISTTGRNKEYYTLANKVLCQ